MPISLPSNISFSICVDLEGCTRLDSPSRVCRLPCRSRLRTRSRTAFKRTSQCCLIRQKAITLTPLRINWQKSLAVSDTVSPRPDVGSPGSLNGVFQHTNSLRPEGEPSKSINFTSCTPKTDLHMLFRVCNRSRARYELNMVVTHSSTYPAEPPHNESDMRSKQSVVNMELIDNDELQILQETPPCSLPVAIS